MVIWCVFLLLGWGWVGSASWATSCYRLWMGRVVLVAVMSIHVHGELIVAAGLSVACVEFGSHDSRFMYSVRALMLCGRESTWSFSDDELFFGYLADDSPVSVDVACEAGPIRDVFLVFDAFLAVAGWCKGYSVAAVDLGESDWQVSGGAGCCDGASR